MSSAYNYCDFVDLLPRVTAPAQASGDVPPVVKEAEPGPSAQQADTLSPNGEP